MKRLLGWVGLDHHPTSSLFSWFCDAKHWLVMQKCDKKISNYLPPNAHQMSGQRGGADCFILDLITLKYLPPSPAKKWYFSRRTLILRKLRCVPEGYPLVFKRRIFVKDLYFRECCQTLALNSFGPAWDCNRSWLRHESLFQTVLSSAATAADRKSFLL